MNKDNNNLFVVRERDNFAIKVIYVSKAFTSEEKLISYLKNKITYRNKDDDILIVDATCMKFNETLGCYELMSIWEYVKERDSWYWSISGYQVGLMFKLPIEASDKGYYKNR